MIVRDQPRGAGLRHILAVHVRALRNARRWSQNDLAEASGLHRTYISLVEREECSVWLDKLERLAEALGVSAADLLSSHPDVLRRVFFAEETRCAYGNAAPFGSLAVLSKCTTGILLVHGMDKYAALSLWMHN